MITRVALLLAVAAGYGTAAPAAGVSLPVVPDGVRIGGVEVGGLISVQAQERVERRYAQPIRLFHGEQSWSVSPKRLGASASIGAAVEAAVRARPGAEVDVEIAVRKKAVQRYVARLDEKYARPAKNSELVGLENLAPKFTEAKAGRRVDRQAMVRALTRVARSPHRTGQIPVKLVPVAPEVTPDDFGAIVVIRRDSNRLHLYDGPQLVREFTVGTGEAKYPTPVGDFRIVTKERDPWWNPPDSEWAADAEPIPPGPGNPLGTRWMGLDVYAVGIHGTPDAASLGYSVSHGCIRMAIPDAEWLFRRVRVGTPVFIVGA